MIQFLTPLRVSQYPGLRNKYATFSRQISLQPILTWET